ncbi:hypothetical protein BU24DRAFT_423860 [Aaosphaeria arxii CBS 175.79]|uniref:Uncharacterized protein n=1 Tax=Aaosphaeria arxii CBS 175.79 TaxID=1450172 RepID=A0A6A5XP69_9PLEO|nr:uncharacterized protein BU24DRAFT_423860 [Aaosphaeria arxii CBS 175.79]KAF2014942.1 hypothetical protein BU24DRAFT_423860 [Aaosphaeria arxii CBS 175.79]
MCSRVSAGIPKAWSVAVVASSNAGRTSCDTNFWFLMIDFIVHISCVHADCWTGQQGTRYNFFDEANQSSNSSIPRSAFQKHPPILYRGPAIVSQLVKDCLPLLSDSGSQRSAPISKHTAAVVGCHHNDHVLGDSLFCLYPECFARFMIHLRS